MIATIPPSSTDTANIFITISTAKTKVMAPQGRNAHITATPSTTIHEDNKSI